MGKKEKVFIVVTVLFILALCAGCVFFGFPAVSHQIDNIITAGPGTIITAVLGLLVSWYCIIPIIIFLIFCAAAYYLFFN